jgi:DHA3 family macrolide efflux protein-like MFS transporter
MPAVGALIPRIVPETHLTRVNGIQGSIQSVSMLAAPMVSGLLMTFASLETLFMVDVVTAIIGISILFFLVKVPAVSSPAEQNAETGEKGINYFHDVREGLRYIRRHGFVFRLIVLSTAFLLIEHIPANCNNCGTCAPSVANLLCKIRSYPHKNFIG